MFDVRLRAAASRLTAVSLIAGAVAAAPAGVASAAKAPPPTQPVVHRVTLVTGDVVQVVDGPGKQDAVTLMPSPNGSIPQAAINEFDGHLYVVPVSAFGLLADHKLDRALFDVTGLIDAGYDDAKRDSLPVLVDYGIGAPAAAEARLAAVTAAEKTVVVPALGMAAFDSSKEHARAFWDDLTTGADETGAPTGLADGAHQVDLDGTVEVALEDSVPQIHAPEVWDAGYDGAGVSVAVLDSGFDGTHPDLQGVVADAKNFTTDPSVDDGNGHGTHVASTIAGSGAASDGLRKGVAPGAQLLVGKVLNDAGVGQDSEVLAGMQWAVDQHADVVSMSLGGDASDGTDVLSRAIDELSASSDSLFVVAAGNNGFAGASSVTAPGTASSALTVGAVDVDDKLADFSGRGPRYGSFALKPEVVAPGVDVTAARATGTELGPIVDDYYTTISGTSMATPHVAGLAALLKQRHPQWDGEKLKAVIASSTVAIPDASGIDAGSGRVDALQAVNQKVFGPASLSLGDYRWPYADLDPQTTALTYRNTTTSDVTLSLDLAGQDGSPASEAMTLTDSTVTVPAKGSASVDVVVDPTVEEPGAYSGVVTADDGSGQTVRTVVGYQLEHERYDLTVVVKPRTGTQSASHQVGLMGYTDYSYESRTLDAAHGKQTVTVRVAPGTFSVGAISFGTAADGAREGVVSYRPTFDVTKDTKVVLDENDAGQFGYAVDREVANDGGILDIGWDGAEGHTGYLFYGFVDRLYAQPSADVAGGGAANVAANWLLSEPEGLLTPVGGQPVPLRPLTSGDTLPWTGDVPSTDSTSRIVDAGTTDAPHTGGVDGAVAVVAADCSDVTSAVQKLVSVGARAVVTYPESGAACAGMITEEFDVPVLQARPFDATDLLVGLPAKGRLVTQDDPTYMYDLVHFWPDSVPDGGTVEGSGDAVSTIRERYDTLGPTAGLRLVEELTGWIPARNGAANVGLVRPVDFPTTVTHYVSTGAKWERTVSVQDAVYGGEYARIWAPPREFAPGSVTRDRWFGGPIGSRVSPLSSLTNGAPPPVREGDEMFISLGAFTDAAGHYGQSDMFTPEYKGRLYADGELVLDAWASVFLNTAVPAGESDYRLVTTLNRENPFWKRSTRIKSAWKFASDTPSGARDVLPLIGADYHMRLDQRGRAEAGRFPVTVDFTMPDGVKQSRLTSTSLKLSWNAGESWHKIPIDCTGTSCSGVVSNKAKATATVKVKASDAAGHTLRQTVVAAYVVGR